MKKMKKLQKMKQIARLFTVCLSSFLCLFSAAQAQSPQECLTKVRTMNTLIPSALQAAKGQIKALMPDPAAYEKTLPAFTTVVAKSDKLNLKNYGGLAEAYILFGNKNKGVPLYSSFATSAKKILEPTDTFQACVAGDIGLAYYNEGSLKEAEPYLLDAINQLEKHTTAANANNLVSDYLCMALLRDKQGKASDASSYSKKLVDLVRKQQTKSL